MSLAHQIGNCIRQQIIDNVGPVFNNLNVTINTDNIVNDSARTSNQGLEATFYIQGLDNIMRKQFNILATELKNVNPKINEFKVKFKRPEKEVRFYLKVVNEISS